MPKFNEAYVKRQEAEARKKLEELHEEGVINLDAPFREIVPVLQERMRSVEGDGQTASGYWLVGSESWFSHRARSEPPIVRRKDG